jgi:hypothetical protein
LLTCSYYTLFIGICQGVSLTFLGLFYFDFFLGFAIDKPRKAAGVFFKKGRAFFVPKATGDPEGSTGIS